MRLYGFNQPVKPLVTHAVKIACLQFFALFSKYALANAYYSMYDATMTDEIIKLMERVKARKGWSEKTMSVYCGNSHAAARVRKGTAHPKTLERFKAWLEEQLKEVA